MPRKTFVTGNILTDTDLNDYLMDQSVMTFADSTARSSAIPAPSAGMVTYLSGSTAVEFWNGASWQNINDNTASVPLNTVTTEGDLIVATGNAAVTRLGKGTAGQVLTAGTATLEWATPSADIPLTTVTASGDLIVANGSASVTRLGIGSENQVLTVGTAGVVWQTPASVSKTVEVFTSSTTWVVPAGVNYVNVYLAAGAPGGGSGGAQVGAAQSAFRNAGGGGGGGGVPVLGITEFKVTPGSTATITVGAGGAGGTGLVLTTGSATGVDGSYGAESTFVIDGDTATSFRTTSGNNGQGGVRDANTAPGGRSFNATDTTLSIQLMQSFPIFMLPAKGGDADSQGGDPALYANNSQRQLFSVAKLTGGTAALAQGSLAGTAGGVGAAGFVGAGGGGGGVRYSSTLGTFVYVGGDAIAGGGAGGAAAYNVSPGFATASAGGNGAANSGAGGGGGGAASCQNGTAYSGAGGNGGSGFVIVTY